MLSPLDSYGKGQVDCGTYRGLSVSIEISKYGQDKLVLSGEKKYETNFTPDTGIGNISRLTYLPERAVELVKQTKQEISDTEKQIDDSKKEIDKPFSKQEELNEKIIRQRDITRQIELNVLKNEPQKVVELEQSR